jgi:hypothetical protein
MRNATVSVAFGNLAVAGGLLFICEVQRVGVGCAVIRSGDATARFWVCTIFSRDVLECARVARDLSARR